VAALSAWAAPQFFEGAGQPSFKSEGSQHLFFFKT